jgi:hypothetical protein
MVRSNVLVCLMGVSILSACSRFDTPSGGAEKKSSAGATSEAVKAMGLPSVASISWKEKFAALIQSNSHEIDKNGNDVFNICFKKMWGKCEEGTFDRAIYDPFEGIYYVVSENNLVRLLHYRNGVFDKEFGSVVFDARLIVQESKPSEIVMRVMVVNNEDWGGIGRIQIMSGDGIILARDCEEVKRGGEAGLVPGQSCYILLTDSEVEMFHKQILAKAMGQGKIMRIRVYGQGGFLAASEAAIEDMAGHLSRLINIYRHLKGEFQLKGG